MTRDLHKKPFSEETRTKLDLFRLYLQGWLPVFLQAHTGRINIFDFFCGPGTDVNGEPGSPLLALDIVNSFADKIDLMRHNINLYFNDKILKKVNELMVSVDQKASSLCKVHITNSQFEDIFEKYYELMSGVGAANFLFIDPNGFIHLETLINITMLKRTDMLLFVPSSFAKRFHDHESIKKLMPGFDVSKIEKTEYVHIEVCNYYKSKLVNGRNKYYIAPFSIKKKKNIYGLIYGGSNLKGLEKFLEAAWSVDPKSGEANISIEGDFSDVKQCMLPDIEPVKMQKFKKFIEDKIRDGKLLNHSDIYEQTLLKGFLPRDVNNILRSLMKSGIIDKTPGVSYKTHMKHLEIKRLVHG